MKPTSVVLRNRGKRRDRADVLRHKKAVFGGHGLPNGGQLGNDDHAACEEGFVPDGHIGVGNRLEIVDLGRNALAAPFVDIAVNAAFAEIGEEIGPFGVGVVAHAAKQLVYGGIQLFGAVCAVKHGQLVKNDFEVVQLVLQTVVWNFFACCNHG